jgi:hypothetical protein
VIDPTRNFHDPSSECPKCGIAKPKPKYIPEDWRDFYFATQMYYRAKYSLFAPENLDMKEPTKEEFVKPDYLINLCVCGFTWRSEPANNRGVVE